MEIDIIPYHNEHHTMFKQLNLEWLDHYGLTEERDRKMLDDPQGTILNQGGFIWMAEVDGVVIGSAALIKEHDGDYELAKMAVAPAYRGKGISKFLMETCMEKAREIGATKLTLFSNHQLEAAIGLYLKYGFRNVQTQNAPYKTADVQMELIF
jgi:ribosomal protein S18 acetylase RimI-like enzyme